MPAKRKHQSSQQPEEILMPMDGSEAEVVSSDDHNPRTNAAMRDGNSSHGSPSEDAIDEFTSDNDNGDASEAAGPYGGTSGGAVGGTPANKRAKGNIRED